MVEITWKTVLCRINFLCNLFGVTADSVPAGPTTAPPTSQDQFSGGGRRDQTRPNVLFVVADDLGWNDVSWHNENIYSPVIESLAAEGVLLDQYYVMPTCTPSRVAMMTGKYPYRLGRQHMYIKPLMPAGLPVNVKIMPQYFKQAGYNTHAIGKWHLGYCHQNYTPTFRGFDTFYGFYLGSQDYYLHNKNEKGDVGYDFRLNEKILQGPEVFGKYSTELFVNRAKKLFQTERDKSKPWFTYLSFQSVHDPIQVPSSYTKDICRYRDKPRYYYSAMVSALDAAMDQVVRGLKETDQYKNTIIVFTTDNGGAANYGGNNFPLRGTKGTLYEGGTRGIGFVHSPLLKQTGFSTRSLVHAVDWLPTLMTAIGQPVPQDLSGVDQWEALNTRSEVEAPRTELVYNIKEKPFKAALRRGKYKLLWGALSKKNGWFTAQEDVINQHLCDQIKENRKEASTRLNLGRDNLLIPNNMDTAEQLVLGIDQEEEYWYEDEEDDSEADYDFLLTEDRSLRASLIAYGERVLANRTENAQARSIRDRWERQRQRIRERQGRKKKKNKKGNKKNGNKKNKKNNNGNFKRRFVNKHGVEIKPYGETFLYDLEADPYEKTDISKENPQLVDQLKDLVMKHYEDLLPRFAPPDSVAGAPRNWGGVYSPGWCLPKFI